DPKIHYPKFNELLVQNTKFLRQKIKCPDPDDVQIGALKAVNLGACGRRKASGSFIVLAWLLDTRHTAPKAQPAAMRHAQFLLS
ncbi:MAG TPA: hypothetical protein PK971_01005, partial [Saprospiraceae bacterium]|nr:hypothetical protein [Saprospiraceae bacterium]